MDKSNLTRLTLFLDPDVSRSLSIIAAKTGMSRSALVTQWVRSVAKQMDGEKV